MRNALIFILALVPAQAAAGMSDDNTAARLNTFLKQNCLRCHDEQTQESNVRLDNFSFASTAADSVQLWTRVLQVLDAGEMPPNDEPRPDPADVTWFVDQLSQALAQAAGPRPIALRRLNRREYENTVHDLLGIEVPLADLLPEDGSVQGFDNVADGLSISSVLMEQYLEAANVAFDAVIRRIKPLPPETRRAEMMEIRENIDSVEKKKGGTIAVANSFVKFTPGWPPARLDSAHPIEDGVYRCRIAVWPHDPGNRSLSVAIYVGALFGPETRKFMGIFDATGTPEKPRIIEFTTSMKEGHAIHIEPRIWPEHITWRDKHEARPGVGIVWAETRGPLDQSFPSQSQQQLFGSSDHISMVPEKPIYIRHRKGVKLHIVESSQPQEDAARVLRKLIPKAFRRPVKDSEMQPFIQLTLDRLQAGRSFEQAVRAGVTAVLCSPQFLLLNRQPVVDDYTIASRLSYFLWSTLPDRKLLQLADANQLSDPKIRYAQIERMVADPRIERFIDNFTGQWLDLRDINFTTPAKKLYPEFDTLLNEAVLGETRHFFRHILQEDLSVLNFVDSDFTFLNERLARHYGIDGIAGNEHFQKVTLPADSIRGGVLTHASVLKVTANGTTTSPVTRGVWVLNNLLGRPVPPPPPGVPAVEPDIRGATTIREQLQKHREVVSCAHCHKRIDPPGFALEQFDAIGGERQWYRSLGEGEKISGQKSYRRGRNIEPSDRLADGRTFDNFRQFRDRLMEDRDRVVRTITSKLLVYATGRPVRISDRRLVDQVVGKTGSNTPGLKSLIHEIVDSKLFLEL